MGRCGSVWVSGVMGVVRVDEYLESEVGMEKGLG